jgi:hypothetical protein
LLSSLRDVASFRLMLLPAFGHHISTSKATPESTVYPESPEGLKSLITDILVAIKSGDSQRSSQLLATLAIPNHREWFQKSFGATEAPRLEAKYVDLESKAPDWLQKRMEAVAKHTPADVTVKVFRKPVDPNLRFYKAATDAMTTGFPIYDAAGGTDFLGDFVYVDGGFRYLDKQVLLAQYLSAYAHQNERKRAGCETCQQSSTSLSAACKTRSYRGHRCS